MDQSLANSHTAALIGRLCAVVPPGLAPFVAPDEAAIGSARQLAFGFSYRELPYTATIERQESASVLRIVGNFGPLPYSAEGARPRRRTLQAMAAAKSDTGLDWHLSPTQEIIVAGEVTLQNPLTPSAMIAGVVGLLLRADAYTGLLLEILGEARWLTSPQAA
jgi:hypothetical protein